mgnify:CR=1 FL=1
MQTPRFLANIIMTIALLGVLLATSTPSRAETGAPSRPIPVAPIPAGQTSLSVVEPLPESVSNGLGCLFFGSTATAITAYVGSENIVNLIAGGIVPVTSSVALSIGVIGVVFSSFCTIGQALTPLVLYSAEKVSAATTW